MKTQFSSDFDFNVPGAMKLQNLIQKLKKWIKILEAKTKTLPTSFLIEEKCRFLSNFSRSTAEVELPGEFLLPKYSHYYVCIQRFMPKVEIVNKHGAAARRLYIRCVRPLSLLDIVGFFLKGPKLEIFVSGIFTQIISVWIGDLGTSPKNSKS